MPSCSDSSYLLDFLLIPFQPLFHNVPALSLVLPESLGVFLLQLHQAFALHPCLPNRGSRAPLTPHLLQVPDRICERLVLQLAQFAWLHCFCAVAVLAVLAWLICWKTPRPSTLLLLPPAIVDETFRAPRQCSLPYRGRFYSSLVDEE